VPHKRFQSFIFHGSLSLRPCHIDRIATPRAIRSFSIMRIEKGNPEKKRLLKGFLMLQRLYNKENREKGME
jgi:hypothetical protein